MQLASVVTLAKPMNVWPSPLPLGSAVAYAPAAFAVTLSEVVRFVKP